MNDENALATQQQAGALTDEEVMESTNVFGGGQNSAYDKVSIPTTGGGKLQYKTSGRMVDFIAFKLATHYHKRFYNVEIGGKNIGLCYGNLVRKGEEPTGSRLNETDMTSRVTQLCRTCPQFRVPSKEEQEAYRQKHNKPMPFCQEKLVLEWDEDVSGVKTRIRFYLSFNAKIEYQNYVRSLTNKNLEVNKVTTILEAKKGKKGTSDFLYAGFRMADNETLTAGTNSGASNAPNLLSVYNSLTPEQKTTAGEYMKTMFNVDSVEKLNPMQKDLLVQKMLDMSKASTPKAEIKKTPF